MWKISKIIGKFILAILLAIILTGLGFRLFGHEYGEPPGELISLGDFRLHTVVDGPKNDKPTVVIEGGGGLATNYYHWLNEGLKDSLRVFRYDRAGIGYSDPSNTLRSPEIIAKELHKLLRKSGELPPYILVGHSLGGPYVKVFTELYSEEVSAIVMIDATHADRINGFNLPAKNSFKFKSMIWLYDVQAVLGDMGIMMAYDNIMGPIYQRKKEGLPDSINNRTVDFLVDGKSIRAFGREFSEYHSTLIRASEIDGFDSLPVRVFPAVDTISNKAYKKYLERGINLRIRQTEKLEMQKDFLNLSSNSKLIELRGNHTSIFTIKHNADVICEEIIELVDKIE